jgi:hypothetical protein
MNWTEVQASYPRHYLRAVAGADYVTVRRIQFEEGDERTTRTVEYSRGQFPFRIYLFVTVESDENANATAIRLSRIGDEAYAAITEGADAGQDCRPARGAP